MVLCHNNSGLICVCWLPISDLPAHVLILVCRVCVSCVCVGQQGLCVALLVVWSWCYRPKLFNHLLFQHHNFFSGDLACIERVQN